MLIRSLSEKNYRLYFVYILIFALIAASSLVCLNVMRQYVNDETIRTIRAMEEISLSKDVPPNNTATRPKFREVKLITLSLYS